MKVTLGSATTCGSETSLCWRLGHACADVAGRAERHEEWGAVPAGIAARCHLLESWLPAEPATGRRWCIRVGTGPAEPVAAASRWTLTVKQEKAAIRDLAEQFEAKVGPVDRRTSLLIREVADALFDMSYDVVRIEPDNLRLIADVGAGCLLSVAFSRAEQDPAPEWADPACLIAGHHCPHGPIADPAERARRELLVRGACAARTLGSALYVTQGSFVSFELDAAPHGRDLPLADSAAADAAVRDWWPAHESPLARDDQGPPMAFWPLTKRIDARAAGSLMGWQAGGGPGRERFPKPLGRILFQDMVSSATSFVCPDGEEPLCYTDGWGATEGTSVLSWCASKCAPSTRAGATCPVAPGPYVRFG